MAAGTLRIATWNLDLSRDGPGLLVQAIASGKDAEVSVLLDGLTTLKPDVVLLTRIDHDLRLVAIGALQKRLAHMGAPYPFVYAPPSNRGLATGVDLDGDGRLNGYDDAQGYGRFTGDGGMAILSRYPIKPIEDFSGFLWRDLPETRLKDVPEDVKGVQRLSSSGHWQIKVEGLTLLAWSAGPAVFGKGLRNANRNHDEARFWQALLQDQLPFKPPQKAFLLIGQSNREASDPQALALHDLQNDPRLGPPFAPPTRHIKGQPQALSWLQPSRDLLIRDQGFFPSGDLPRGMDRMLWIDVEIPLYP